MCIRDSHYIKNICEELGLETYLSKAYHYDRDETKVIKDRMVDMGPLGGIISAFMYDRNSAWLVIASDMPFVDKAAIQKIVKERQSSYYATSYSKTLDEFPEPTFTIYEPKIYSRILDFMSLGYTCPRKVLINSDIQKIIPTNTDVLRNINTPQEKKAALTDLNKNK